MNSATHQLDPVRIGPHAQQRLLAGCLLASVAAHGLLFVLLPGWTRTPVAPTTTLEVVMVPAEPVAAPASALPVEKAEPAPRVEPKARRVEPVPPPREIRLPEPAPVARSETPAPPPVATVATERPAANPQPAPVARPVAPPAVARVEPARSPPAYNVAYLRNPPPRYPAAARRNGSEGTVMLRVLVSAEGLPVRVELEQTSGSSPLDTAALEAVKGWRFVPARRGEQSIEDWVRVPVVFRLES